jgi:ATP-dependent helicase/nuclease subunit A
MEISRDEVRVMTVHGAKGLEAPIVILADTTTAPAGPAGRQPRLLPLAATPAPSAQAPSAQTSRPLIWLGRKEDDVALVADARMAASDAAENEHRRLLYVAMTRAADHLVVCGAVGERAKPMGCWYDLVHEALTPRASEQPTDDGPVWRLRPAGPAETEPVGQTGAAETGHKSERPAWLDHDAPPELPSKRGLSPSGAFDESTAAGGAAIATATATGTGERSKALARGTLVHRLLQSLPAIPPDRRAEAAHRYLIRSAIAFSAPERDSMVGQVLAVLEDARFFELFGPDSRAEVPIVGRIMAGGRTIAVSGQVDRLAVTTGGVLIADYKTNRPAPRHPDQVPSGYVTQLALYRAVLGLVYPDRPVRTVLLWTDVPDLMEISAENLDRGLDTLGGPHLPVKPP